ncbi:hypothetical protein B0T16DRAFT_417044 [Cercophora newfieldiana]|uniref:Uncharacterized protein n=1 Tax=Cercophora newfieldiana TaxID=92897 RepID=A0AA40CMJ1_9PEZI|nr:hypothetical protein B0T16DRAFT_417044 [Cercophora newfieldiana]
MDIDFLEQELDLERLHRIMSRLWIAGRPMPPRPLHHQRLLNRDIIITERMDLHLVWTKRRIFIKPIPRFLLHTSIWQTALLAGPHGTTTPCPNPPCVCTRRRKLRRIAHGFLFSYAALIAYESDLLIAKSLGLVPPHIEWPTWQLLVAHILRGDGHNTTFQLVDERFVYGELRLSRLNKIYRLTQGRQALFRGYLSEWATYGDFFRDNLAWLAGGVAYVAIVLTAMQVGLGTDRLRENDAFQAASFGFTVLSILGSLGFGFVVFAVFCAAFLDNWVSAVVYKRRRLGEARVGIGVS